MTHRIGEGGIGEGKIDREMEGIILLFSQTQEKLRFTVTCSCIIEIREADSTPNWDFL